MAPKNALSAPVDLTSQEVSAYNDQSCIGTRNGSDLGCTAKEFTVGTAFSAKPGTPPFCVAGSSFEFLVDIELSGSNADRYDISFYTGQTGNSPSLNDSSKTCSATAFVMRSIRACARALLPAPWR